MKVRLWKSLAAGLPALLFAACNATGPTDPMDETAEEVESTEEAITEASASAGDEESSYYCPSYCEPKAKIVIEPDGVNEVGRPHEIRAKVFSKCGGDFEPVEDALVKFKLAEGSAGELSSMTCTTNEYGKCKVTLTSDEVGTSIVKAETTVQVRGTDITVKTDGVHPNSDPIKKRWVDAFVEISPEYAENEVGEEHDFIVTCTAVQPEYMHDPTFVIEPRVEPPPDYLDKSDCVVPTVVDNVARCRIRIRNDDPGTFTANAQCTVTMSDDIHGEYYSATVIRDTDGPMTPSGLENSGPATKVYVGAGSLEWKKVDEYHNLLGGATFKACRVEDRYGDYITPECITVEDNGPYDRDPAYGKFLLTGLDFGTWKVFEIEAPDGYTFDPNDKRHAELTLACPEADLGKFVNFPEEVTGDEGCTPGYWKNHLDSWPIDPYTKVSTVFPGVTGAQGNQTLIQALRTGGGGSIAFLRQAVAAYLNAVSQGVDYALTSTQVKQIVQTAFATGDFSTKSLLEDANEAGCPLN